MKSIGADHSASQSSNKAKQKKHLRKSAVSPQTPNTLQEPSAKALPTSSKVKINAKFTKLVGSGDKEKSVGEKSKVQVVSSTQSKKNLFQKRTLHVAGQIDKALPPSLCLSPSNKAPVIRRESVKSSTSSSQNLLPLKDAAQSNHVYGMRSGDQDHFIAKDNFSQLQMSPIVQYYNQINNQGSMAETHQKLSHSQLFSISQLRQSQ